MEIELQYVYAGRGPLLVPVELAGVPLGPSSRFTVVDAYFDTQAFDLRRAGCSLRVRRRSDLAAPLLTWKGPSSAAAGRARSRSELELEIEDDPDDGAALESALARHGLRDEVAAAAGAHDGLAVYGRVRNERSSHDYVDEVDGLELVWDRLDFGRGAPEVRLEVEAKREPSARLMERADAELRVALGDRLAPAPHGKSRELGLRLFPDDYPRGVPTG